LNVRYVLEGGLQRAANRMRVNVQLIDATTGSHLWAERFDKPLADLFEMQDQIVDRLANALNARLVEVAITQSRFGGPLFQGQAWVNKARTPDNVTRARSLAGLPEE
jgi:hypothetical protein